MCCGVLQCVAVCCSVLRSVAMCWCVLQCVAVCYSVWELLLAACAACSRCRLWWKCYVLQCIAVRCSVLQCVTVCCSVLQCVAVCCSVLQCAAVCCSVLQCGVVLENGYPQLALRTLDVDFGQGVKAQDHDNHEHCQDFKDDIFQQSCPVQYVDEINFVSHSHALGPQ